MTVQHDDHGDRGVFYLEHDGERAARMTWVASGPGEITIQHTEVGEVFRGQGVGRRLVDAAVAHAREQGLKIVPVCSYARSVFDKDPSIRDVLARS